MQSRLRTLLVTFCFVLGLLSQAAAAGGCAQSGSADAGGHSAHMQMSGMDMEMPADSGCCDDSEQCLMQACFTGAALPCQAEVLQLPPLAALLPLAPVRNSTPVCSRFERPPIFV